MNWATAGRFIKFKSYLHLCYNQNFQINQKININKPHFDCNNNKANANWIWRGVNEMSKNNSVVPQARAALDQFKMEAAREVGVQSLIKKIYNI